MSGVPLGVPRNIPVVADGVGEDARVLILELPAAGRQRWCHRVPRRRRVRGEHERPPLPHAVGVIDRSRARMVLRRGV